MYSTLQAKNKTFVFKSLSDIKLSLGHKKIDIFKMDIEGSEWDILLSEIVHGDENGLPDQLLFEIHTQGL